MQKVLITGASGFLGSYVVQQMLKKGYSVIATSTKADKCRRYSWFEMVNYIPFRFEDYSEHINYFDFFHRPDLIIHLAWEGLPNYQQLFHFETNLPRHYAFLKNLVRYGAKNIAVTGTCLEYGFREGSLQEEMVTDPLNAYAIAKDSLRKFLQQLQDTLPFDLKWMRLFYMYGQGQSPKSVFSLLNTAIEKNETSFNMSGGEQLRDYLPVDDVAKYIVSIATQNAITGVINCCSGKPVRLLDLVRQYLKERNSNISLNLGYYPYLDYEPMQFWGDNTKLLTILEHERSF